MDKIELYPKVVSEGRIMLENGKNVCNCVDSHCVRFGKYTECIEYNRNQEPQKLPFCKRPENQTKENN